MLLTESRQYTFNKHTHLWDNHCELNKIPTPYAATVSKVNTINLYQASIPVHLDKDVFQALATTVLVSGFTCQCLMLDANRANVLNYGFDSFFFLSVKTILGSEYLCKCVMYKE